MSVSSRRRASVVIPSYRRPDELRRCLAGLACQSLAPTQITVVRRAGDVATQAVVAEAKQMAVTDAVVTEPGVLAAMAAGVQATQGEIIAFIDDDAVPHPDWLGRLVSHFDDPGVGGVGGRDIIVGSDSADERTSDVGRVTTWGKLIGNHHRGTGRPRNVMVLKAAGMAFRREALVLPHGMRGAGAQVHFEVGMSLSALRQGWRLIYDATALVDHHVAPRFDADRRGRPAPMAVRDAAYNLVTCLVGEAPELFWRRAVYGLLIGDRRIPGLVRAGVAVVLRERDVIEDLRPSLEGQLEALWRVRRRSARRPSSSSPVATDSSSVTRVRPRVALLAHDIHAEGGMERACMELIRRGSSDVDFVVISSRLDGSLRAGVKWRRVPIPRRPFPLKFVTYYALAGAQLARERVDLVHTVGAIVPNKVDVASVHFCHAAFRAAAVNHSGHASRLRRVNTGISHRLALLAESWSYRSERIRLFAAVSEGVEQELDRFYPGTETAVTVNGVEHARFRPDGENRGRVRAEYNAGPCTALFVGGDWDRKGLALAIEGLARARERGRSLDLWVVGPGDRPRFEALAVKLGVGKHVRFFGHRRDTDHFYQAADIFVLPTLYETFCLVAFEAAASGLPLIITPVHGAVDLVGDQEAGIVIDRDSHAVGAAMTRLADDPQLRRELGAAGRRRSRAFTWDRSAVAVLTAYATLLAPPSDEAGQARPDVAMARRAA